MPSLGVTRNLIAAETAERGRKVGGYTFNAFPPEDYEGFVMVFAAVRLGDHAHVEIQSGRITLHQERQTYNLGVAGRICLQWHQWVKWRDELDATTVHRIAEVERPTQGQLDRYVAPSVSDDGEQVFPR